MAIQLKGGIVTEDRKLDRVPQFDPKSVESYHIRGLVVPQPLRSKTYEVPVGLDQGQEGACVGNGWAQWMAASPHLERWVTEAHARYIYFEAQKNDPWPGGEYAGATPQYSGTSVLSGAQVMAKLGLFKEYRWATSVHDIALAINQVGPVVLGIDWYENMYDPDSKDFIHVEGQKVGGHCILCHGYNHKSNYYKLWNSWDWHECKISEADLEKLLLDGGEACIPVGKTPKIPAWPATMAA